MAGARKWGDDWKRRKILSSDSNACPKNRTLHADTVEGQGKGDGTTTQQLLKKRRVRSDMPLPAFIMPPSTISLVTLGFESKFDTVTIPNNVVTDYIHGNQSITDVSPQTADALLRQIAGLTTIAQTRSLEAHDMLTNIKCLHEIEVAAKEKEISMLHERLECLMKESKATYTNIKEAEPVLLTPKEMVSDGKTGFTSDSEDQTNTTTSSLNADIPLIRLVHRHRENENHSGKSQFPYMSTDVVARLNKHNTCSKKSLDIIYGMPKRTRSGIL